MLPFRWEYKASVTCHNVNTQNVKITGRDKPHFLVSHQSEAFENLLHTDVAPVTRFFHGFYTKKIER